jgi:bifunctional enzyme CysN/CysC
MENREQLNFVIIGHVDHGKSTVIGRLLADTGSLPQGKLEGVQEYCRRNSRVFEYAFLLDALKEEQAQGITIDSARCFFKTKKRDYMIIDAPGHVEFVKNMITGASRAQAAVIVIDIREGIQENTRRHGYIVSLLGIRQVAVAVNKMDLAQFGREPFERVKRDYGAYLAGLGVSVANFIPLAARDGENLVTKSDKMPWYDGPSLLEQVEAFESGDDASVLPFRFPVQDVYKFTQGDDRRILAGTVSSGKVQVGDEVEFYPSRRKSRIRSVALSAGVDAKEATAGQALGFTIEHPLYIRPGEIMAKVSEKKPPYSGRRFLAHLFWMGSSPMLAGKNYLFKIGTLSVMARIAEVRSVLDAGELSSAGAKDKLERYDVAECVIETVKPAAFDRASELQAAGRFVVIDNFNISGCGIVLEAIESGTDSLDERTKEREIRWDRGSVTQAERETRNGHRSKFVVIAGENGEWARGTAKALERALFVEGSQAHYVGLATLERGLESDLGEGLPDREEKIRRLGELARLWTDAGLIVVTGLSGVDRYDLEALRRLNAPSEIFVAGTADGPLEGETPDLVLSSSESPQSSAMRVIERLREKEILTDFQI